NGWTDNFQGTEWLTKSFIPQARAKAGNAEDRILLIFDGHGSHLTQEFRDAARNNKVDLFMLPAHTTHKSQPCDVGCFGPLQKVWIDRVERIAVDTDAGMPKHDFVNEYMEIRKLAIKPETVKAAFRKTGIAPFNANIFTEADFAPSRTTSTKASFPPSFP
ncbi:hypothetical protein JAAARDRAFT_113283, partial [Jaapia argillacea MUCL 33604]